MNIRSGDPFYDALADVSGRFVGWLASLAWSAVLLLIAVISSLISRRFQPEQRTADQGWQMALSQPDGEDEQSAEGISLGQPLDQKERS
jgi:hypothetical protein